MNGLMQGYGSTLDSTRRRLVLDDGGQQQTFLPPRQQPAIPQLTGYPQQQYQFLVPTMMPQYRSPDISSNFIPPAISTVGGSSAPASQQFQSPMGNSFVPSGSPIAPVSLPIQTYAAGIPSAPEAGALPSSPFPLQQQHEQQHQYQSRPMGNSFVPSGSPIAPVSLPIQTYAAGTPSAPEAGALPSSPFPRQQHEQQHQYQSSYGNYMQPAFAAAGSSFQTPIAAGGPSAPASQQFQQNNAVFGGACPGSTAAAAGIQSASVMTSQSTVPPDVAAFLLANPHFMHPQMFQQLSQMQQQQPPRR